jgi:hypothetical protein
MFEGFWFKSVMASFGPSFRKSFSHRGTLVALHERSRFRSRRRREFRLGGRRHVRSTFTREPQPVPHLQRDIIVERAGVGLFIVDSQFRKQIEDHVRLDLEFASQLVNTNLTHKGRPGSIR